MISSIVTSYTGDITDPNQQADYFATVMLIWCLEDQYMYLVVISHTCRCQQVHIAPCPEHLPCKQGLWAKICTGRNFSLKILILFGMGRKHSGKR